MSTQVIGEIDELVRKTPCGPSDRRKIVQMTSLNEIH
jgi:hypothetical protein